MWKTPDHAVYMCSWNFQVSENVKGVDGRCINIQISFTWVHIMIIILYCNLLLIIMCTHVNLICMLMHLPSTPFTFSDTWKFQLHMYTAWSGVFHTVKWQYYCRNYYNPGVYNPYYPWPCVRTVYRHCYIIIYAAGRCIHVHCTWPDQFNKFLALIPSLIT